MDKTSTFQERLIEAMDRKHMRITDLEEASGVEKQEHLLLRKKFRGCGNTERIFTLR